ncbi:MAG TPA: protein translocase subunit SecF, partial [bacterium]|nr:protein translocase subunit SecF [bacterium]
MNLQIIKHRNLWLSLSGIMVVASIIFISLWGLKFGLDFTGGSLLEVKFTSGQPSVSTVQAGLNDTQVSSLIIQPTEDSMILRFQESDEDTHQAVVNALRQLPEA